MRKRLISILLICATVLCALPALAASTEEEWNASCSWAIAYDTTLYSASFNDETATGSDLYTFTAFGSIQAGKRVSILSSSGNMREIYYWNGGKRSAWVADSAVRWVGSSSSGNTGSGSGGTGTGSVSTGSDLGGSTRPSGSSSSSKRTPDYDKTWKDLDVVYYLGDGESIPVILQTLGTAFCKVYDPASEEFLTVPTVDLFWETEATDEQRLAIVYAPKTGQATLRAKPSTDAKSLAKCKAGRIVVVLEVGSTFTRVLHDGEEGYILTAALTLCGAVPEEDYTVTQLAYRGRTEGSSSVAVYTDKKDGRKISQWKVGIEVPVFDEVGAWSEIEVDGYHGWIKTEYLK